MGKTIGLRIHKHDFLDIIKDEGGASLSERRFADETDESSTPYVIKITAADDMQSTCTTDDTEFTTDDMEFREDVIGEILKLMGKTPETIQEDIFKHLCDASTDTLLKTKREWTF